MRKKLTLVLEESVIEQAKRMARQENTSVSEVVERYFISQSQHQVWKAEEGSVVGMLSGSVAKRSTVEMESLSDDEKLEKVLREKYA